MVVVGGIEGMMVCICDKLVHARGTSIGPALARTFERLLKDSARASITRPLTQDRCV